MRKIDLVNSIHQKTGIPKVDVLVTVEALLKEDSRTKKVNQND
jgi:DNA-binding protein HU-beta